MSVVRAAWVTCDGPDGRGCPEREQVPDDHSCLTVVDAREEAKCWGWTHPVIDGKRIDQCGECTEERKEGHER